MNDVNLKCDDIITGSDGTQITVNDEGIVIQPVIHHMAGTVKANYKIVLTGLEFEKLKDAISRRIAPERLLGKPIETVGGEKIYIGIR